MPVKLRPARIRHVTGQRPACSDRRLCRVAPAAARLPHVTDDRQRVGPQSQRAPRSRRLPTRRPRPATMDPLELGFKPRPPVPWLGSAAVCSAPACAPCWPSCSAPTSTSANCRTRCPATSSRSRAPTASCGSTTSPIWATASTRPTRSPICWPSPARGRRSPAAARAGAGHGRRPGLSDGERAGLRGPVQGPLHGGAAVPAGGRARPSLYAVPGNHDWYDGLTAFLRLFARQRDATIGGWRTRQSRSYFAVRLPGRLVALRARRAVRRLPRRPAAQLFRRGGPPARPDRQGHPGGAGAVVGQGGWTPRRRTTRWTTSSVRSSRPPERGYG